MRKFLSRIIAVVAEIVYDAGCDLYRLSDRLDGWDGTCKEPQPMIFHIGPPTVTWSGTTTVTYTTNQED